MWIDVLAKHPDMDAVLVITVPLNHIPGLAQHIIDKHHKPVFFYDGDVPASLPNFRGFASGFRIYQGADPAEYTAFFSNSLGGAEGLRDLGAKAVHTLLLWGRSRPVRAAGRAAGSRRVLLWAWARIPRGLDRISCCANQV